MADGFSVPVPQTGPGLGTRSKQSAGKSAKAARSESDQSLAKAETTLLAIYWFLYNDENHSTILNQSWPVVFRIFSRLAKRAGWELKSIDMRKRLLDAGYTAKPKAVVGHAGLTGAAFRRLIKDRVLKGDRTLSASGENIMNAIRDEARIVARSLIRENARNFPELAGILKDIESETDPNGSTEWALDREPMLLPDGELDKAENIKPIFSINATGEEIGARVQLARRAKGWTQLQLAQAMGLNSKGSVQALETAKSSPSIDTVRAAMEALDITEL